MASGGELDRVASTLFRAWLGTVAPIALHELRQQRRDHLGKPVENLLEQCGGLENFISRCPELEIKDDWLHIVMSPSADQIPARDIASSIEKWTSDDIELFNSHSKNRFLVSKTSREASLENMKSALPSLKKTVAQRQKDINRASKILEEEFGGRELQRARLEERKNKLQENKQELLEKMERLELKKIRNSKIRSLIDDLDKQLKTKRDQLSLIERKTKTYADRIQFMERKLDTMSKDNQHLSAHLLNVVTDFNDRQLELFKVTVSEKNAQSNAISRGQIYVLEQSIQKNTDQKETLIEIRDKLIKEIEQRNSLEVLYKQRIDDSLVSQDKIINFPVKKVRDNVDRATNIPLDVFVPKIIDVDETEYLKLTKEASNLKKNRISDKSSAPRSPRSDHVAVCPICLEHIIDQPYQVLDCLHELHNECLELMRSGGSYKCPLCRRFEASKADFPALNSSVSGRRTK